MFSRCADLLRQNLVQALVVGAMFVAIGSARAATLPMNAAANAANAGRHAEEPPVEQLGPLTTSEKQGYGCIMAGGAALGLTSFVGTGGVAALFTGTAALPATAGPAGVGLVVAGTVFASTCAVGALVAPTVIRLWKYYYDGAQIAMTP